jgi:hypothetical protein
VQYILAQAWRGPFALAKTGLAAGAFIGTLAWAAKALGA